MNNWKDEDRMDFIPEEEGNDILALTLEDGTEEDFEVVDEVEYKGENYVILLPLGDEDCDEVVIVKVVDREEQIFESVDDEDTLVAVFETFQKNLQQLFDFSEEE